MLAEEEDRILIFKEPASDKTLKGHVIRAEKVTDAGELSSEVLSGAKLRVRKCWTSRKGKLRVRIK